MDIGKHITELLVLHDCVIVPQLGGFVANYKSAEVNDILRTISPPSKSVLFNKNLKHNDGLLIGFVAQKAGIGYKDAEQLVIQYTKKIANQTDSGGKSIIEDLGYFYKDKENNLQFQPELSSNFLIDSYGLSFVQFEKTYRPGVKTGHSGRYISLGDDANRRRTRMRRWAYTGVAASLIAAMILIPIKTGKLEQINLGILHDKPVVSETPEYVQPVPEIETNATEKENVTIQPVLEQYHIIVGSFKEFGNARDLRNKLSTQGYDARILRADNGFFRVTAQTLNTKIDASVKLTSIRSVSGMENAWILKD